MGRLLPMGDADLDRLPLFEGEPMVRLRYSISCPFVSSLGNGDIFASDQRLLAECLTAEAFGSGVREWKEAEKLMADF